MLRLQLPSRAVAPVEPPDTAALLASDGSLAGIAAAVLAHPDVAVGALDDDDLYALAEWALRTYAASDEGLDRFLLCQMCGQLPSVYLHIADRLLGDQLNMALMNAFLAATAPKREAAPEDSERRIVVHDMSATLEEGRRDDHA